MKQAIKCCVSAVNKTPYKAGSNNKTEGIRELIMQQLPDSLNNNIIYTAITRQHDKQHKSILGKYKKTVFHTIIRNSFFFENCFFSVITRYCFHLENLFYLVNVRHFFRKV